VGLGLTAFAAVALLVLNRMRGFATPQMVAAQQAGAELAGLLEERLWGTEDVRSAGATAYTMSGLYGAMRKAWQKTLTAALKSATMQSTTWMTFAVGAAVALAAYLFKVGAVTIGTVFLIYQYTQTLAQPLQGITEEVQDLQKAGASVVRVDELFHIRGAIEEGDGIPLPTGALAVEVQDVSFGYGEERTVLHDLSFHLEPGKVLGLLGRTGSGKTTITRLLFRLYEHHAGAVRLGGVDIRMARLSDLRRRVGMVTQDVQLFHATVRDNLTLFDRSIADDQILRVIGELGLWEWYAALPAGLDTELASGGSGLSAGEAQLLALTRVFLKDPGFVILDEASSRLDPATERLVERAVARLLQGRTGIVIAHRLATVQRVDEILILDEGRIREQGPRIELASDPRSVYSDLLRVGLEEALA
jgi:ABC-type multidrug transport system fused ATPase/permease subunit